MAITTRQTSLLVQQDWTKIYQTFREADFQSFDFESLRKSMIEYLRTYYPEDFNDFTESSEYIALIDLIAFLGQSLAFRTDLNARENFLDTAERRDSILKLAKLLSYNPKRNTPAAGYLKFDSVSTTEMVYDSTGTNLSNLLLTWNDVTNDNWLEQFTAVLNAALVSSQAIGRPGATQILNSIKTDEYSIDILNNLTPVYTFKSTIAGSTYPFEVVSATSANQNYIYEIDPTPNGKFNILYRNDNQGNGSNNTGYFLYFKQGELKSLDFTITETLPNRIVSINFNNINNSDVWLYSLNSNGTPDTKWTQVPAVNGINVIYNNRADRNLYSVSTRANDQIDLVFGDGSLTNIPIGKFRVYYRQSNNLTYKITPEEMASVVIAIPYRGRTGRAETLTVRASLQYTVTNASTRETLESIRNKAPQQYYTQNRMITGEDYNILPYTSFNNILKVKAVNRASSGISRYLDVIDSTGKYSSTNIFSDDGIIYKQDYIDATTFQFSSSVEVNYIVQNRLRPLLTGNPISHLYYSTVPRFYGAAFPTKDTLLSAGYIYQITTTGDTDWESAGASNNEAGTIFRLTSTITPILSNPGKAAAIGPAVNNFIEGYAYVVGSAGDVFTSIGSPSNEIGTYFISTFTGPGASSGYAASVGKWTASLNASGRSTGTFTAGNYTYLTQGALIKFIPPTGYYFDAQNNLVEGTVSNENQKTELWASIISYPTPGTGTAILSIEVPTNALIKEIIPVFSNDWGTELTNLIAARILSYQTFGLRYDYINLEWAIITEFNLASETENFSFNNAGNTEGNGSDQSWSIRLDYANQEYTATIRGLNYFFQSDRDTRFYFDPDTKVYDSRTGTTRSDNIKVLRVNTKPDSAEPIYYSQDYKIWGKVIESDGYEDNRKILITFPDENLDSVPDNPDLFYNLVRPDTNVQNKFVYFEQVTDQYNFTRYNPIDQINFVSEYPTYNEIETDLSLYPDGTIFYAYNEDVFYVSKSTYLTQVTGYIARIGRQSLIFQYTHNAPNNRRIDPSPNNLIDFYILTKNYSDQYFAYIQDTSEKVSEPTPPTSEELKIEFGSIENLKAISDSIIYNTASFKPLFGARAVSSLRATFKVVKNPNLNISDNDIKSQVISAINTYFDINNWDFGETFYFSELSAYLHSALSPNVSSIIIVPSASTSSFGTLYQINAEPNEIVVSAATVDNVQIISAITAGQINQ